MDLAGLSRIVAPVFFAAASGCARMPSPLEPAYSGSIGLPYRGCLTGAVEMEGHGPGYRFLRSNDRHFAAARFAGALERAAARVAAERRGSALVMGDLSTKYGGHLLPHLSHRTGHDADLILYAMTPEGVPVESPGFVHYGPDGLAWDETSGRYLRFDVEREWLLVKALLLDPEARVEWMFANKIIEALLLEWAGARFESPDLLRRLEVVMLEPQPGGPHDDHIHVRTACSPEEEATGCETGGPVRPWLSSPAPGDDDAPTDAELVAVLVRPIAERE
jgi:penicillin-insensitive murein endopeptidase